MYNKIWNQRGSPQNTFLNKHFKIFIIEVITTTVLFFQIFQAAYYSRENSKDKMMKCEVRFLVQASDALCHTLVALVYILETTSVFQRKKYFRSKYK